MLWVPSGELLGVKPVGLGAFLSLRVCKARVCCGLACPSGPLPVRRRRGQASVPALCSTLARKLTLSPQGPGTGHSVLTEHPTPTRFAAQVQAAEQWM